MTTTVRERCDKSQHPKTRKITWYAVRAGSDIRWRAELPVRHLKAKLVTMTTKHHKFLELPNDGEKFPWHLTEEGAEYPAQEGDYAVWKNPSLGNAIHCAGLSANGVRVLAELDDNFLSPSAQNIFMRQVEYAEKNRTTHLNAMASMDGMIFSTDRLRDIYYKAFKKEAHRVPDLHVARNHVDPDDWEKRIPILPPNTSGRPRVGWMGSSQHVWDLRLAAPALRLAYDMGCEVVIVGLDPANHDPKWKDFLTYTHVPWSNPKRYHKSILNFDIGLIPIVQNAHTTGKSDVKFLEYAMSGAAVVVQNAPIYNKTVKHGETGLLAGGPDEMGYMMAELIKSPNLRKELARNAKQYVLENRTIQGNLHEWSDAIYH